MRLGFEKTVCLTLALLILVISVCVGCEKDGNGDEFADMLEALSQYYESEDSQEKLESATKYRIIIPAKCGVDILDGAAFLSDLLSKNVGYSVEVEYDSDVSPSSKYQDILIGTVDRKESKKFLKDLKYYDHGYGVIDGKIIIAAHNDEKCAEAIDLFTDKIVSGELSVKSLAYTKTELMRAEYEIEAVRLNDFDLCEYTIVYPKKGVEGEEGLAKILRDKICEKSGYYLPIVLDSDATDSTRAICVGNTSIGERGSAISSEEAIVSLCSDGSIELLAKDNIGIYEAMTCFLDLLFTPCQDGSYDATLDRDIELSYDAGSINFLILRDGIGNSSVDIYRNVVNSVYGNNVAFGLFEFCADKVIANIDNNIGSMSGLGMLADCYINSDEFVYKKLEYERIDDGMVISVILERKSDGSEIAFVRAIVNNGGISDDSDELYQAFSDACSDIGDRSALVVVDPEWNKYQLFINDFSNFSKSGSSDLFFFTENCLLELDYRSVLIDYSDGIYAEVIKLKPYYK